MKIVTTMYMMKMKRLISVCRTWMRMIFTELCQINLRNVRITDPEMNTGW